MAIVQSETEQRILLRHADWETYERLLRARGDDRTPRYAYDRGKLEIVSPLLPQHEECSSDTEFLVRTIAEELNLELRAFRSMTMKREDIDAGVEPDASFYIRSEPSIRGRNPDLRTDPPPDLAIEIDITNPSLEKLPIYARFGVSEVWRYTERRFEIWVLEGDRYSASGESRMLAGVTTEALSGLLIERRELGSTAWARRVRAWAHSIHT